MNKFKLSTLILLLCLIIPYFFWLSEPSDSRSITIVDKTVPTETYREHHGLTWLMNHWHLSSPTGQKAISTSEDYYGFHPDTEQIDDLEQLESQISQSDIIYLADTYGVYEEEDVNGQITINKIVGGLSAEELHVIDKQLHLQTTKLFVEYNVIGSPTEREVRNKLTNMLGLEWSGWMGRYFPTLDVTKKENEVPEWAVLYYEEQHQTEWDFTTSGYVFIHEDGSVIVVEDENSNGLTFTFTEQGEQLTGLKKSQLYRYWFDIHEPTDHTEVLANYTLPFDDGKLQELAEVGIQSTFPAVVQTAYNKSMLYYFAGDFVDVPNVTHFYQYKGLPWLHKLQTIFTREIDKAFFWRTYVPLFKSLLDEPIPVMEKGEQPVAIAENDGISMTSKIDGQDLFVYREDRWEPIKLKGVNIGMGKPGAFPGEAAITEEEYYRWLEMIGEMNANSIRIYTIHPPGFYRALKEYNEQADEPIYLLHGVWVDEGPLEETLDAFNEESTETFIDNIEQTIDIIHGNAMIDHQPGHASGIYDADISPYVTGYVLGIEWYSYMVKNTIEKHNSIGQYDGKYVYTEAANPMEYWLASIMDHTATYEQDHYGWQRPLSFTNWVTTDLLEHPYEPFEDEDFASIDPNHIHAKPAFSAGMFASYHVYPYYPEFLNITPKYLNYVDFRGKKNNYAGYLYDLKQAHDMPVLIAEFGIPESRGKTHSNPYGFDQGEHSEEEQGRYLRHLYEDIVHQDFLGGLVFAWQDEWFKRTWNTMELDDPDRRPFWSNVQTNEQRFGLLTFDPLKIKVDGDLSDWEEVDDATVVEGQADVTNLKISQDETYLYMAVQYKQTALDNEELPESYVLVNTIPDQGNRTVPFDESVKSDQGIDFIVQIGNDKGIVLVDSYYDPFYLQYRESIPEINKGVINNNSGIYHPIRFALNKEFTIPATGEHHPFEYYETGDLLRGNGNPKSENYNSLTDYSFNPETGVLEIRLPWLLLNVKDPSQREIMGNMWSGPAELETSLKIDGIDIGFVTYISEQKVTLPHHLGADLELLHHTWNTWQLPDSKERLKQSYYMMKEAFGKVN